jgi:hypothetical protein
MKKRIAFLILCLIPWPLSHGKLVRHGNAIRTHIIVFNVHVFTITEERFNS